MTTEKFIVLNKTQMKNKQLVKQFESGGYKIFEDKKVPVLTRECGNANPNGNIKLTYKGGCMKIIDIEEAYRCTGCGGWFHKECIFDHFKQEKEHDFGRHEERIKIKKLLIELGKKI